MDTNFLLLVTVKLFQLTKNWFSFQLNVFSQNVSQIFQIELNDKAQRMKDKGRGQDERTYKRRVGWGRKVGLPGSFQTSCLHICTCHERRVELGLQWDSDRRSHFTTAGQGTAWRQHYCSLCGIELQDWHSSSYWFARWTRSVFRPATPCSCTVFIYSRTPCRAPARRSVRSCTLLNNRRHRRRPGHAPNVAISALPPSIDHKSSSPGGGRGWVEWRTQDTFTVGVLPSLYKTRHLVRYVENPDKRKEFLAISGLDKNDLIHAGQNRSRFCWKSAQKTVQKLKLLGRPTDSLTNKSTMFSFHS